MIKLFDPENKFWQFLNKVTDAALMSLLWLLTSLPLVTIGASTAAFYSYTLKQVSNQEGSLVKSYFSAFRAHFKRATLLWLLQAAGTAFFAADLWAVWNFLLIQGGAAGVAVLGVCGFCALAFLCCCLYAYPVLAGIRPARQAGHRQELSAGGGPAPRHPDPVPAHGAVPCPVLLFQRPVLLLGGSVCLFLLLPHLWRVPEVPPAGRGAAGGEVRRKGVPVPARRRQVAAMRGWMERLRRWRDREGEKLRGMTLPKRIGYVFTYYKGWMLGFLVLALFAGYAADVVIQNQKETVLQLSLIHI